MYVYWRRPNASYSRLHRAHPEHPGFTWCGAICAEGHADVSEVFHLVKQPRGVELCEECATRPAIRLNIKAHREVAA